MLISIHNTLRNVLRELDNVSSYGYNTHPASKHGIRLTAKEHTVLAEHLKIFLDNR